MAENNPSLRIAITKVSFQNDLIPTTLTMLVASVCWFGPLTNTRVYENAFALGYIGVNTVCLYVNLAVMGVTSLIFVLPVFNCCGRKQLSLRAKVIIGLICGLIGSSTIAASYLVSGKESDYLTTKVTFIIGQVLNGIFFSIVFCSLAVCCIVEKATVRSESLDADKSMHNIATSMLFVSLPSGFIIASMINQLAFTLEHTYFTQADLALKRISQVSIIYVICLALTLIVMILSLKANDDPPAIGSEEKPREALKKVIKSKEVWHAAFTFGFIWSVFFLSIPEFENITNAFPFIFEVSRIFQLYYMIGASFACASYNTFFGRCINRQWVAGWVFLAMYLVSQALMLGLVEKYVSVAITSTCAGVSGFSIMHMVIASTHLLIKLSATMEYTYLENCMLLGFIIWLASVMASIFTCLADEFFYSNRDVTYWAYILNTAFTGGGFLISAALLNSIEVKL